MIFISITTTPIFETIVSNKQKCPKCGHDMLVITINHIKSVGAFGLIRREKLVASGRCEKCNKKTSKKNWDASTIQLVEQKMQELQPSFMRRIGTILITLGIVVALMTYVMTGNMRQGWAGEKNFTEAYGSDASQKWYKNLQVGDYLLCNKYYSDPAEVFQIESISETSVTLKAFDQSFEYGTYEKLNQLDKLPLGNTSHKTFVVHKKPLFKLGQLKDISKNELAIPPKDTYSIMQIKKSR